MNEISRIQSDEVLLDNYAEYDALFSGRLSGVLNWNKMDEFWALLGQDSNGWYIYTCNEDAPVTPSTPDDYMEFLDQSIGFIRERDTMNYCGAVYADGLSNPTFVKMFDPKKMGSACGSSKNPALPKWIISRVRPREILKATAKDKPGKRGLFKTLFSS